MHSMKNAPVYNGYPMLSIVKSALPWWGKIGAKIVLSRMPMAYSFWQRMGLFRHGSMDRVGYAAGVFNEHVTRAGLEGALNGKTILEVGPGDSIASAIIACSLGARAVLVDSGPYAREDMRPYRALCELLRSHGLNPPDLSGATTLNDALELTGGQYLTEGLESWRSVPSNSVDFVFSQAVLEHVRRYEFLATQEECFRVMKHEGVASHRVDLRDHLGGALNNLRFSERVWESPFLVRSGFYTNRIQMEEMLRLFEHAGFEVELTEFRRWPVLPTPRKKLNQTFATLPDDALNVSGFDVLLRCGTVKCVGGTPAGGQLHCRSASGANR